MRLKSIRYPRHVGQLRAAAIMSTDFGRQVALPKTLHEGALADQPRSHYGFGQSRQDAVRCQRRKQRAAKQVICNEPTWIEWQEKQRRQMAHRQFWTAIEKNGRWKAVL